MGLLDRLAPRKNESVVPATAGQAAAGPGGAIEPTFTTKALRKFLSALTSRKSPVLVDLGPVVGGNVNFFGEQLGCKIFVEDLYADVERHVRQDKADAMPAFFARRFAQADDSVDGILCWDLIDYLDRASAQELAKQLMRILRPEGVLLGFFGSAQPHNTGYTKYVIVDEATLKYRASAAARGRQAALLNRDIIRLFPSLRVSDSFLLQNNLREILFRKI
jgi:hypothetical protein